MATWMDTVDALQLWALRARGARSRYIDTALGPVHAVDWRGEGPRPPIVLFHGLASCGADYAPLMRWLRRRHQRVLAPDLPGHGRSVTPDVPLTADRLTGAMLEAMDALLDRPALVFGNSLGGVAAIRYAQHRPERVLALALASPGGAPMDAATLTAFKQGFDLSTTEAAVAFMGRVLGGPQPGMRWLARGARLRMQRPGPRSLLDNVTPEALLRPDELAGLRPPTLILWGDEDDVMPAGSRRFFSAHLPTHGRFEAMPGFGHTPYMDDLRGFTARLGRFIDGLEHTGDAAQRSVA